MRKPVVPFENYDLTAEEYKAHRDWILHGGPEPAPDVVERVRRYHEETYDYTSQVEAARSERWRQLRFGFWSFVGVASWTALVVFLTLGFSHSSRWVHQRVPSTWGVLWVMLGAGGLLASAVFRDTNRKRD